MMSETTGPSESEFSWKADLANMNQSDTELSPMRRAVEVEHGREIAEKTQNAIEIFRTQLLDSLPMGVKTRQKYNEILDELSSPDGTSVHDVDTARFIYASVYQGERILGDQGLPEIEIGEEAVQHHSIRLHEAAMATGLDLQPVQLEELSYNSIIWHELGHAFQKAYSSAANGRPMTTSDWIDEADLTHDSMAWGLTGNYFDHKNLDEQNQTIASESFAEGFSYMALERYMVTHNILSADRVSKFSDSLKSPTRGDRATKAEQIIHQYEDVMDDYQKIPEFYQTMRDNDVSVHSIGYAHPLNSETVLAIMGKTMELEDLTWQARLRGEPSPDH